MRRKLQRGIVVMLCMTTFSMMMGCNKSTQGTSGTVSSAPESTQASSSEIITPEETEIPAIDIDALDGLEGIELTATDKAHSLYQGMFGEEEIILSLWIDKEALEARVSFVGAYRSEKVSFDCELLEDGVRFHDDKYYLLLKQQEDDVLTGYFYESGTGLEEITLSLEAINYSEDKEHLYQIGTDEEVEGFAQKVLDAINAYDFEAFSDYISYPVIVHVNQAIQTIETKEDFLALGEDVVFTDEFSASLAVAYPNIMMSNIDDGVMLGDGSYNVWINSTEDGELKVISVNN